MIRRFDLRPVIVGRRLGERRRSRQQTDRGEEQGANRHRRFQIGGHERGAANRPASLTAAAPGGVRRTIHCPHERRPAPIAADPSTDSSSDSLTVSVLPERLRARLAEDPDRPVRLRDPATGRRWVLAPDPARPPLTDSELTEAELDEIDRRLEGLDFAAAQTGTDAEAIRRGLAQADAGELLTEAEVRAKAEARLPFLGDR